MNIAPILPVDAVGIINTHYHFCFAELALSNPGYAEYYHDAAKIGDTVIMDTMVYEGRPPMQTADWLTALDLVKPTVAISMDVIGDSKATRKRFAILEQLTQIPLMGVAQGHDYEEYVATFKFFAARCKWVGLPMQPALERRQERIRLLQTNEITCNIHLLGMSRDDLMYEQSVRYLACIKGIDSTKPIAAALNGIWLPNAQPQATKRKADYFATPNEVCRHYVSLMWYNVKYLKGLVCACTD